jgi:hypothetical protein
MWMEKNGFLRTWIYTLDRNTVRNVDFMLSQVTPITRAAGMISSEDEVTGIHTPSGSMQHDR